VSLRAYTRRYFVYGYVEEFVDNHTILSHLDRHADAQEVAVISNNELITVYTHIYYKHVKTIAIYLKSSLTTTPKMAVRCHNATVAPPTELA